MIINYFFRMLMISMIAIACNSKKSSVSVQLKIRNNAEKQNIYLEQVELDGSAPMILDSASIEKGNSEVKLKGGSMDPEALYRVILDDNSRFILMVPDQSVISADFDLANLELSSVNSPATKELKTLLDGFNLKIEKLNAMRAQVQDAPKVMDSSRVVLEKEFSKQVSETGTYTLQFSKEAASPAVSLYALSLVANIISPDQMVPVVQELKARYPASKRIKTIEELITAAAQLKATDDFVGTEAPEIKLPDMYGRMFSLRSLRGKYVLVDFWASWCQPCRMENPNVVKAFNKFSNRNFTILGVSLDRAKEPWVKAINDDGLYWNHVSDLKYWDSEVVAPYKIEGIPFNVLVDPKGIIIAKDLRGEQLITTLEKFLK